MMQGGFPLLPQWKRGSLALRLQTAATRLMQLFADVDPFVIVLRHLRLIVSLSSRFRLRSRPFRPLGQQQRFVA
jgi:hypothetical protein